MLPARACGSVARAEIILHIGAHRTGTTALQAWLLTNQGAVSRAGIAFRGPESTRSDSFAGLVKHPELVDDEEERRALRAATAIEMEIDRLPDQGATRLIVSEQNLAGTMRDNLARGAIYPDAGRRLGRVSSAFKGRVAAAALTVRGYEGWWGSVMACLVGCGDNLPAPAALAAGNGPGWPELVEAASPAFPGAAMWLSRYGAPNSGPAAQLAATLGGLAPPEGLATGERCLNRRPEADALRRSLARRGDFSDAAAIGPGNGRWQPFLPGQKLMLARRHRRDLAALGLEPAQMHDDTGIKAGIQPLTRPREEGRRDDGKLRGMG